MPSDDTIRAYLLEELPEETRAQLDARLFAEPDLFALFEVAEDDLIDDYVRQRLTPDQYQRFEQIYLVSRTRRERVDAARVLHEVLRRPPAALSWPARLRVWWAQSAWSLPALATALLLLILGGALWFSTRRPNNDLAQQHAPSPTPTPPAPLPTATMLSVTGAAPTPLLFATPTPHAPLIPVTTPTPRPTPPVSQPPVFATLLLQPGRGRDDGAIGQSLKLSPDATQTRLVLTLPPSDYVSYRVALSAAGGAEIFRQKLPKTALKAGQLTFVVPAARLVAGDYVVRLYGQTADQTEESISDYFFRVQRK